MRAVALRERIKLCGIRDENDPANYFSHRGGRSFLRRAEAVAEQNCRVLVGKEEPEGTDGKSHMGQLNVQRFSDCLLGHQ